MILLFKLCLTFLLISLVTWGIRRALESTKYEGKNIYHILSIINAITLFLFAIIAVIVVICRIWL